MNDQLYTNNNLIKNSCKFSLNIGAISKADILLLTNYFSYISYILNLYSNDNTCIIDPTTGEIFNENTYFEHIGQTDEYGHFNINNTVDNTYQYLDFFNKFLVSIKVVMITY